MAMAADAARDAAWALADATVHVGLTTAALAFAALLLVRRGGKPALDKAKVVADGVESTSRSACQATSNLFDRLGRPTYVLAPMVDQSELPFRLLARRYGTQLCYTPMLNANQFVNSSSYRAEVLAEACEQDRPLIAQIAGHDPEILLKAGRYVEHMCDAVDLNLGCPQGIARRGRYGSYLLEEEDLVVDIVRQLSAGLSVPVTCKIRLFRDDLERTLRLVRRLEAVGCAMLTVHGRTRFQNKQTVGSCDFSAIAAVKRAVRIPVIANGGIATLDDVHSCLKVTGADAVMSSEAALENPALFCGNRDANGAYVDQTRLAREYLELAAQHLPSKKGECPKCVKAHIFKLVYAGLQDNRDLRDRVGQAHTLSEYRAVVEELAARGWREPRFHETTEYPRERSWYYRHQLEAERIAAAGACFAPEAVEGCGLPLVATEEEPEPFCISWD